jgi:hypothetical protein
VRLGRAYSETLEDAFELQERLARHIVEALGITLTSEENRALAVRQIRGVRLSTSICTRARKCTR